MPSATPDPGGDPRRESAISYLNAALGSFGVQSSWADAEGSADVHIHFAVSTPEGGAGDGVLGFTTAANDVYLVTGWNFYTGLDGGAIGPNQFDFLTLATHELAHTVGLGESSDPQSVLYEYLAAGTVRRTLTDTNLARIDTNADRFMKTGADVARARSEAAGRFLSATAVLPASSGGAAFLPHSGARAFQQRMGGGGNLLIGGDGDDVRIGGLGRELLVGGIGRDWLATESGDLQSGGSTACDQREGPLLSPHRDLSRDDIGDAVRVPSITASGDLNDSALNAATISHDGIAQHPAGGAAQDLFFASLGDALTDNHAPQEIVAM
jgi:Ca2+-binding RTX toxin-like protein